MIISRTPMRISFLGGGSDLPSFFEDSDGFVVSAAINKHIYITVNSPFENCVKLHYSVDEKVAQVRDLQHNLAKNVLIEYSIADNIEIGSISDFPTTGTGMGSSSSYCVGLICALQRHTFGFDLTCKELAEKACHVEINKMDKPIGKQDQFISAFGGLCNFTFKPNGDVDIFRYKLTCDFIEDFEKNLILLYTGITRSADHVLEVQSVNTKNNPDTKKIIKEVVSLAKEFDTQLKRQSHNDLGSLLDKSWRLKSCYASTVSSPGIESIYNSAINYGAKGGKLLGAGGGGFFLLYADQDVQKNLKKKMANFKFFNVKIEHEGSKIIYDNKSGM